MSLKVRFLVFTSLWLLAGLICAVFADFIVQAGDSRLERQAVMVFLAPVYAATGLAFVVVPRGYNDWFAVVFFLFLSSFVAHAVVTLTRKTPRAFLLWTAAQVIFLIASIASTLYFWHWDALHMHG